MNNDMLAFFKALADPSRLKIVGLLAQRPYTVEQLSAMLELKPSTLSHHLSRLAEAGLVTAKAEGYYSVYQFEEAVFREKARTLLKREELSAVVVDVDLGAFDRKVISDYTQPDGRLKTIPAQRKKLEVVLRYVAEAFKPGSRYSEKRVNEILGRFHQDTASLRRELVGYGFMQREGGGGDYWRSESKPPK